MGFAHGGLSATEPIARDEWELGSLLRDGSMALAERARNALVCSVADATCQSAGWK